MSFNLNFSINLFIRMHSRLGNNEIVQNEKQQLGWNSPKMSLVQPINRCKNKKLSGKRGDKEVEGGQKLIEVKQVALCSSYIKL